jgi:hypothetical protein
VNRAWQRPRINFLVSCLFSRPKLAVPSPHAPTISCARGDGDARCAKTRIVEIVGLRQMKRPQIERLF